MTTINSVGVGLSGASGTGSFAGTTSPSFTTPALGTPTAGVLSSCSGYAQSALTGLGTGVSTALGVNVGTAGAPVVLNGALGTPSSGTLTNSTGLPTTGLTKTCSFMAYLGTSMSNATGDGTLVTVVFDSVIQQTGTSYDVSTGIFTAPTTGYYLFNTALELSGNTTGATTFFVEFSTNVTHGNDQFIFSYPIISTDSFVSGSCLIYLTAAQTLRVKIQISGITKTITIYGDTLGDTRFSGILVSP